jgi:hypothetical protein
MYKILKPFLDPVTASKIEIVNDPTKDLRQYFQPHTFWSFYGGFVEFSVTLSLSFFLSLSLSLSLFLSFRSFLSSFLSSSYDWRPSNLNWSHFVDKHHLLPAADTEETMRIYQPKLSLEEQINSATIDEGELTTTTTTTKKKKSKEVTVCLLQKTIPMFDVRCNY